ncbi:MAG: class I SAM-dependent methyltransferase, partial [Caldilineaceae bacterium]
MATVYNQDPLWSYYQTQQPTLFTGAEQRLTFLVHQLVRRCPNARVLDIGIGNGLFEKIALAAGLDVYCLDPSSESIRLVRERYALGIKAQVGYSQQMPFRDNYFDGVVLSEVIEHLSDEVIAQTLPEVRRVLRQDGCVLVTVPARENLANAIIFCPHCQQQFHRWGHLQSFTPERLTALFSPYF